MGASAEKTVDNKVYNKEEIAAFTWQKKKDLIHKDPMTCARQFDFQVQKLISTVLKSENNPVGKIIDFFYEVEFH